MTNRGVTRRTLLVLIAPRRPEDRLARTTRRSILMAAYLPVRVQISAINCTRKLAVWPASLPMRSTSLNKVLQRRLSSTCSAAKHNRSPQLASTVVRAGGFPLAMRNCLNRIVRTMLIVHARV